MILLIGDATFDDVCAPLKGKSEWGMDMLVRKVHGARSEAAEFMADLEQGQDFEGYYLQSWEPDSDDPVWATISLVYKGLLTAGTPVPLIETDIVPAAGSVSKSYVAENGGLGRVYRKQGLYQVDLGITALIGQSDLIVATRDIYTSGATMEFTYDAIETTYRYVREGRPDRPRYFQVAIPRIPVIKKSRFITADGAIYGTNAPIALTIDLSPDVLNRVVGFKARSVIGTPYYECEDTVRRELGEGDSDGSGSFGG